MIIRPGMISGIFYFYPLECLGSSGQSVNSALFFNSALPLISALPKTYNRVRSEVVITVLFHEREFLKQFLADILPKT